MSAAPGTIAAILQNVGPSTLAKDPAASTNNITSAFGTLALGLAAAAGAIGVQKLAQTSNVPGVVATIPFSPALAPAGSNPGLTTQQNPNSPPKNPANPANSSGIVITPAGTQNVLFWGAAAAAALALLVALGRR